MWRGKKEKGIALDGIQTKIVDVAKDTEKNLLIHNKRLYFDTSDNLQKENPVFKDLYYNKIILNEKK